eukprot:UN32286
MTLADYAEDRKYPRTEKGKIDPIKVMFTDRGNAVVKNDIPGYVPPKMGSGYYSEHIYSAYDSGWNRHNDIIDDIFDSMNDTYDNYLEIVLAKALEGSRGITMRTPVIVESSWFSYDDHYTRETHWGKPAALVKTLPGFLFSSYPSLTRLGGSVVAN